MDRVFFKKDPVFFLINNVLCRKILQHANKKEVLAIEDNNNRKRIIIWINIFFTAVLIRGFNEMELSSLPSTIGIMAPVFITGGIWFSVSFKGMSTRYLDSAINVVFWLYLSLTMSITIICVAVYYLSSIYVFIPFCLVALSLLASTIIYDNLDLLRKD